MPRRAVRIERKEDDGSITYWDSSRNDPHADEIVEHTLVPGKRYVVSPISANKAPKYRGRSCVYLKPRYTPGRVLKARVMFEDDESRANIEPNDLLPYDGEEILGTGACLVKEEKNPNGPLSETLIHLKNRARDSDPNRYRDKFLCL